MRERAILEQRLPAFERKLEQAGAPWTPGPVPPPEAAHPRRSSPSALDAPLHLPGGLPVVPGTSSPRGVRRAYTPANCTPSKTRVGVRIDEYG